MQISFILAFAFYTALAQADSISLLEALRTRANATKFASFLEANPDILAVYSSSTVQTVFAPSDVFFAALIKRESSPQQKLAYQYTSNVYNLQTLSPPVSSGAIVHTGLPAPKAGGTQATVSEKVEKPANGTFRFRRDTGIVPTTGIRMLSGLGSSVNIIRGDIPYSGGLIHSTDGFFTLPSALSSTVSSTGLSTLGNLLSQANLTDTLDAADSMTIFTPSNAAFSAAANSTSNSATLPNLLSNHVVPNFLGYLPALVDGAVYRTLSGDTLKITVKNGVYFVNGAKIISSNTILSNGVAHVIDKVLVPTHTPVTTSGSSSLGYSKSMVASMAIGLFVWLMA
ncbi:FAS1 domain-containing protein [Tricladium varicosporioides]|nr:FAS1 domain-containing protein [Hymenoscyphus varicosporioides]